MRHAGEGHQSGDRFARVLARGDRRVWPVGAGIVAQRVFRRRRGGGLPRRGGLLTGSRSMERHRAPPLDHFPTSPVHHVTTSRVGVQPVAAPDECRSLDSLRSLGMTGHRRAPLRHPERSAALPSLSSRAERAARPPNCHPERSAQRGVEGSAPGAVLRASEPRRRWPMRHPPRPPRETRCAKERPCEHVARGASRRNRRPPRPDLASAGSRRRSSTAPPRSPRERGRRSRVSRPARHR